MPVNPSKIDPDLLYTFDEAAEWAGERRTSTREVDGAGEAAVASVREVLAC
jgi:hypothetical protein